MKFKVNGKVEESLFSKLGCIVHETIENLGINEVPYTYEDGFYVDYNLSNEVINEVLINTHGWLTTDDNFVFEG